MTIVYMYVGRCTLVNTESTTVVINIFFCRWIGSVTSREATSRRSRTNLLAREISDGPSAYTSRRYTRHAIATQKQRNESYCLLTGINRTSFRRNTFPQSKSKISLTNVIPYYVDRSMDLQLNLSATLLSEQTLHVLRNGPLRVAFF